MTDATANSTSILKLVNKTMELPTIPEVLVKLNDVIASEDSSADDVAKVISVDPAVSTNILRIVNSAYYGLQVRVSSIGLAVSIMGFSMTKKVALKAAVFSVFGRNKRELDHFSPVEFWKHSIFTGVAARALGMESSRFGASHAEDLYICGLLHDIGKIIIMEKAPEQYQQVLAECARSGRNECEVENDVFGFTHADVGSVLGVKWFLPEDLTIAIRYHHAPSRDPFHRSLSSLIHLADHLACANGFGSTRGTQHSGLQHEVYDQIGLDPRQVEDLLPQIREDFESTGQPWE
ncbi:MAG: HDOD domain-containing protein [Planctomycetes bacterium]|nr:HDOD domain-containing protein [Planctomycetota bacterium]